MSKRSAPASTSPEILTDEHRQMIAEGIATLHRFSASPTLKDNKPHYGHGATVAAIQHAKSKRTRRS